MQLRILIVPEGLTDQALTLSFFAVFNLHPLSYPENCDNAIISVTFLQTSIRQYATSVTRVLKLHSQLPQARTLYVVQVEEAL